ncbi:MAG: hypothetical protein ACRETP_07795, partial [Steroidobacteraceae bacterium]
MITALKSLAVGACLALTAAGCATTSTPRAATTAANRGAGTTAVPPGCEPPAGTRITGHQCVAFGSTYSAEELRRTGAVDPGEALRRLDTAI